MSYLLHDPDAGPIPFSIDFADVLPSGDALASVVWSIDPVESGGVELSGSSTEVTTVSTQKLDGGVIGNAYRVTARATTDNGNVIDKSITLQVGEI